MQLIKCEFSSLYQSTRNSKIEFFELDKRAGALIGPFLAVLDWLIKPVEGHFCLMVFIVAHVKITV